MCVYMWVCMSAVAAIVGILVRMGCAFVCVGCVHFCLCDRALHFVFHLLKQAYIVTLYVSLFNNVDIDDWCVCEATAFELV